MVLDLVRAGGEALQELRTLLTRDKKFRELVRNPLLLQLAVSLHSAGATVDMARAADKREGLLSAYVEYAERRMQRSGTESGLWLPFIARVLRDKHKVMYCPDRAPVEFLPLEFAKSAERRTLMAAAGCVAVISLVLRGAMVLLAPESPAKPIYLITTIAVPLTYGHLAWLVTKKSVWDPLTSRKTQATMSLLRFAKRAVILSLIQTATVWLFMRIDIDNEAIESFIVVALIGSTIWPALQMTHESSPSDPSEIPNRVGGEIASLIRSTAIVAALVSTAIYVTLSVTFSALEPAIQIGNGLLYDPLINSLFFVAPVALIAALKNGGADLLRRDQCRRIMVRYGYLPKRHGVALEEIRKSSLVIPRRGAFEFRHSLIRDFLARRLPEDMSASEFVPVRSAQ
ncbi:hypothetical protein GCM10023335_38910 [Streptomyces siamensis]|uniref:Uncharacterized protein n=1 Tax=Streptomyces siamensis TaxID=1274986 RepID=A0ABP9IYN9_9ACTN